MVGEADVPFQDPLPTVVTLLVDATSVCSRRWIEVHAAYTCAYVNNGPLGAVFIAPYYDAAQSLDDPGSAHYKPFPNIVRPEPTLRYLGAANRNMSLTFHLRAEDAIYDVSSLRRGVAWLSDLNQCTYSEDLQVRYAPPMVEVALGSVFQSKCVVDQVSIRWVGPWSGSPDMAFPEPHGAEVTLGLVSTPEAYQPYGGWEYGVGLSTISRRTGVE